ncbi:MAG: GDSL-type esterase/lipase family protein [Bacteroidota bacterium]
MQSSYGQDWPNLSKYKAENDSLGLPENGIERIVFMGNSITEGWILNDSLGFFRKNGYVNRGIGGQTTPQMLIRFRQDVIELKPSVVVILAGINDIAGNTGPSTLEMIMNNIESMAELAKSNNIKVIISSVLPAQDFPWSRDMEPAEKVIKLNGMLKEYCNRQEHYYLDYFSHMVNDQNGLKSEYTYYGTLIQQGMRSWDLWLKQLLRLC